MELIQAKKLKSGLWLYIVLLIFEGALRKWVLPQFSDVLLIVRDPLALYLILKANSLKVYFNNKYLLQIWIISVISLTLTMTIGHLNILLALYGLRAFLLHVPIAFLMGRVFDYNDVIKVGKYFMIVSIPMTILLLFQFFSPQTAWVNRGVGGNLSGAGFDGALGYLRPPGTFSFTNGTSSYYGLLAPFLLFFIIEPKNISPWILRLAGVSLLIAIPISISRTLLFQTLCCLFLIVLALMNFKGKIGQALVAGLSFFLIYLLLNFFSFFDTSLKVFSTRFERANEAEGGIESVFMDRYLGGLWGALIDAPNIPIAGIGLGYGTNVGSYLITNSRNFLLSEGEWGRVIGEIGPILGLWLIIIRIGIAIKVANAAYFQLKKESLLPWALLGYMLLNFPQGSWNQPTSMGFSILSLGLCIASLKKSL